MGASKGNMQQTIKEIAEELDCGNDCYYNRKTSELIVIPQDLDIYLPEENDALDLDNLDDTEKYWIAALKNIDDNFDDLIKFEIPASFESFKIMEDFHDQVGDEVLKARLSIALSERKPFRNFKFQIDNSDYRAEWFEFKQKRMEEIVKRQFDRK